MKFPIRRSILYLVVLCSIGINILSCKHESFKSTKLVIKAHIWNNEWVYIKAIPFTNEKHRYIDSLYIKDGRKEIVFDVPNNGQRVYKIIASEHRMQIDFVNDVPEITIKADYIKNKFNISGSPATAILQQYYAMRKQFGEQMNRATADAQYSLKLSDTSGTRLLSLKKRQNLLLSNQSNTVKHFLDTVSSPSVFIVAYNDIDYGKDYKALRSLMNKAIRRFPNYAPLKALKAETDGYIDIYTHELQVGDVLPYIQLPDQYNQLYSTSALKGKYYFIDFWSTWCGQCVAYAEPKRQADQQYKYKSFAIVSVLLDDQKEQWKNIIKYQKFTWKQLIDEKQWSGPAARTIKFDSIPFNYLVAPDGKILAKAIKPNELLNILSKHLKSK